MALELYAHPFSSYCQKALVALYEAGTPFAYHLLDHTKPETFEPFRARGRSASSRCWWTTARRSRKRRSSWSTWTCITLVRRA